MTMIPIHIETLKILYERGFITPEALTAIAPITWLAKHYPELLKESEKAVKAIAPKPRTCKSCIHFSQVHKCCMTQIDGKSTYLAVKAQTPACQAFEGVKLPAFVRGQQ